MSWTIEGRHVLITGGNSGIGRATAAELARRGAQVTITARDPRRGASAAAEIDASTGATVIVEQLDLASLDSIRAFADRFSPDRLDVLINNAGVMTGKRLETPDGFEWTFGVNHLGPFLLTNLLTRNLVASAPSRVITVSSENYRRVKGGLDFDDLQAKRGFNSNMAYAGSKLANILFTIELDRRLAGSGVTARALHPGVVGTSFGQGREGSKTMGLMMRLLKPFLASPAEGASTSVHLATASDDEVARGLYWADGDVKERLAIACDQAAARQLWDVSAELVGL
ncbi:MAG TPA: SDR family oxidoreductase [Acidimicrobiia bacterium]|jgi:NAD(P)-dependent dehydrogenase (short-subunit alcohol dehydrogenase family)